MNRFSSSYFYVWKFLSSMRKNNSNIPEYTGNDLGLTYSSKQSSFRIWAPTADSVQLRLQQGHARRTVAIHQYDRSHHKAPDRITQGVTTWEILYILYQTHGQLVG